MKKQEIEKYINSAIEKIKNEYKPEKVILFGSYAYGKPESHSDIDLFILKNTTKRRIERFCDVRRILREMKGVPIQPLVLNKKELDEKLKLEDDFILEIMAKGIVVYEKEE